MIKKWMIIGILSVLVNYGSGQISQKTDQFTDSLLVALDTTRSNYRIACVHHEFELLEREMSTRPSALRYSPRPRDNEVRPEKLFASYQSQEARNEPAAKQRELERLRQKNRIARLSNYFVTLLLMLALTVSFFLVIRNRMKRKLAESELRNQKLASEQIRRELEGKQRDLTNLALEIARKNELFTRTNEILKKIQRSGLPRDQQQEIRKLIQYNTQQLRINEDMEELLLNIERVNADFFEKLSEIAPHLTPSEKQLCSFLRLNLGTKDIASIRNISPKSVEMARYRLRKKLPIDTQDDIYTFIQGI